MQVLKSHLVLVGIIAVLLIVGSYALFSMHEQHDHDQAVLMAHDLDAAKQRQVDLEKQAQQQFLVIQAQQQALEAQNKALSAAISARNQALSDRQKQDAQLSPTELSTRMAQLAGVDQSEVKAQADGSTLLSQSASVVVTAKLEEIPTMEANTGDLQTQNDNKDKIIAGLQQTISLKDGQIAEDKKVLAAQIASDKAEIAEVKAKARKNMFQHIGIGIGIGLALAYRVFK